MNDIFLNNVLDINKLEDAKKLKNIFSQEIDTLNIRLFDYRNEYYKDLPEILKIVEDNLFSLPNLKNINLRCVYEKLPKEVFKNICKLYKNISKDINCQIVVEHAHMRDSWYDTGEVDKCWDVKTIIKANTEIDKVCKFIRDSKFSPMEAFAYIHAYVQNVAKYRRSSEEQHSWDDSDQFFAGAFMDMPEFVCTGYASLMNEIITNLNMPGLESKMMTVSLKNLSTDKTDYHARNFIKIKDDKYKINQTFFDDATWDGYNDHNYPLFAHFAMPNGCHKPEFNGKYQYTVLDEIKLRGEGSIYDFIDFNEYQEEFDKSKIKINQLMIEKIYFRVLKKMYPTEDVESLCKRVERMTKSSFEEQTKRQFKGYFATEKSLLGKEYAQKLYAEKTKSKPKNDDLEL